MNKLPLLISYAYRKAVDWDFLSDNRDKIDLLVDSGAFTEYKSGKQVKLEDYMLWVQLRESYCRYFVLDVIGDYRQTDHNYQTMLHFGNRPIPIFTRGTPTALIKHYPTSLIGIGGISARTDNSPGYLKRLYESRHLDGRRIHWLGFADHDFICRYRPASVDTSPWCMSATFGQFRLFTGQGFVSVSRENWRGYTKQIEALGFDSARLRYQKAWESQNLVTEISGLSYLDYIDKVQKRIGTTIHLVCVKQYHVKLLLDLFNKRRTA